MRVLDIAALAAVLAPAVVHGKHLTPECLKVVYQRMIELNTHSWENGTRAEATLEWTHPELSVYAAQNPSFYTQSLNTDSIPEIMEIANAAMDQRPTPVDRTAPQSNSSDTQEGGLRRRQEAATSSPDPTPTHTATPSNHTCDVTPAQKDRSLPPGSPLVPAAGAAGDPPSLGVPILMADRATNGGRRNGTRYEDAATSQVNFVLYHVPRATNGAISHRECSMQLWADNVYMVPPFLAYYGAMMNNKTLVEEAVNQIKEYREILQDKDTKLWAHMSKGWEAEDPSLWATGNAWVVAGTARVIATIKSSQFADEMKGQIDELKGLAAEVFDASKSRLSTNGLLHNHINDSGSFEDSSASILMAAAGLRFSTMGLTNDYVPMSLQLLAAGSRNVNGTGYLTHVTDPMKFVSEGAYSAEGQSFLVLAYAAYNDWEKQGKPGNDAKDDPLADPKSSAARTGASIALAAAGAALALLL